MRDEPVYVGVDFGSQRLVTAQATEAAAHPLAVSASVVHLSRRRAVIGAMHAATYHPAKIATDVKQQLGADSDDYVVDDRSWRPEALAAVLLRGAVAPLGSAAGKAKLAITVSASFDSVQRRALRSAVEIASLDAIFVSDAAAGVASWLGQLELDAPSAPTANQSERALVCDLGAATCDLAIIHREGLVANIEAMQGETWGSGGWDALVLERIAACIEEQAGESPLGPLNEKVWRKSMTPLASKLRCELDQGEMASWESRFGDRIWRGWLYAHELEELARPMVDWLEGQLRHLLEDRKIDRVLLTGGGSRMPLVRQRIEHVCGVPVEQRADVTFTACGAARLARAHAGDSSAPQVTDVAPCSLGVQTVDRRSKKTVNKIILDAGTPLPCHRVLKLGQIGDVKATIKLLQGELLAAEDNRLAGECQLTPEFCGNNPVQLRLGYDRCGQLELRIQLANGDPLPIEVFHEDLLSPSAQQELQQVVNHLQIAVAQASGSQGK